MGRASKTTGRTVAHLLQSSNASITKMHKISQLLFANKKKLYLIIDDTLIKKIYATNMRGACLFYDTKLRQRIMAYKVVTGMLSDGDLAIPIGFDYLYSKEIVDACTDKLLTKDEIVEALVSKVIELFPNTKIIITADGLYASVNFLKWCTENKYDVEVRMHANRKVTYKGVAKSLKQLATEEGIKITGRKTARTISVAWHGLLLEVTIVKRVDKKGAESIVFQAATYKAEPRVHVKTYKIRWKTEKAYRTSKQSIGIGDCFSQQLTVQRNHTAASLLAYAIAQLEMKRLGFDTPEQAIRALREMFIHTDFNESIESFKSSAWYHA